LGSLSALLLGLITLSFLTAALFGTIATSHMWLLNN
jgi:hypothetical protein